MTRTDFQQGMELVPLFKMNTVTENYWLIYAAATAATAATVIIMTWSCGGIIFSHRVNLILALRFHALLIVTILSL